ncbi:nucleoside triphosphate pyrophosphatase [Thioalkalivibrio sp. ALE23]|uniref:Maf family protein n=1 Tax=Thioalkalivibrio sp. ALE23 TaxID=1265495 RepID=UPI00037771DF|nr:Maf family protein [Thioalkalivibrio sp. ALE23]
MSFAAPGNRPDALPLLLASASPRRRELLTQIGVVYEVAAMDVDETAWPGEDPAVLVERLAAAKAEAARGHARRGQWVLAADTVVTIDGEALGKPADEASAAAMLQRLSGREHRVITGMALLRDDGPVRTGRGETRVWMRPLDTRDIAAYWASGEPRDKAGGYALQARGAAFVERIDGSCSNVIGLPLFELEQWLNDLEDPPARA